MDTETVWSAVADQRRSLADLFESLDERQWAAPSLCAGWTVGDVAAHVTLAARVRPATVAAGLLKSRGSFNGFVAADAREHGRRPKDELVADLRRLADSRQHPPFTRPVDPLVDILVHGQDVAVPLGVARMMPSDAAVAAADRVWSMGFPFRARRRLRGYRLVASNAEWSAGDGETVVAPIEQVLLMLTGRRRPQE